MPPGASSAPLQTGDYIRCFRRRELGEGLEDVFGAKYWEDEEAKPFSDYFNKIQSYELALRDGNPGGIAKPTLSNATLQATILSVEEERAAQLIDNVSPGQNQKQGRKLNELSARLIIERTQFLASLMDVIARRALARDFPNEVKDVRSALENNSTLLVLENDGNGAPRTTLQDNWGAGSLTATRQPTIDYLCCA
ncbi:hypothetical protein B0H14DRAFT_2580680 [Mycena olivaceomarginata]|nr:hypothetical protein B0H14DRAFT_2580680 [Mycena olivaceomarginata]